jgi:hypothetical protein
VQHIHVLAMICAGLAGWWNDLLPVPERPARGGAVRVVSHGSELMCPPSGYHTRNDVEAPRGARLGAVQPHPGE